jgi:hypothetical protein
VARVWQSERVTETRTPRRSLTRITRAAVTALLIVAATGCLKVDMDLTVEGETASGHMLIAIDRVVAQTFGMGPEDLLENAGEEDFSTLEGVSTLPFEDDDWIGAEYAFNRVSLDDLNALAGTDEEFPRIEYDAQADTYEFSMVMDMSDFAPDEVDENGAFPGLDPTALLEQMEVRISITFPGAVIEHNGQVTGTTVTWEPVIGERTEMRAVASASGGADDPAAGDDSGVDAGLPGSGRTGGGSTSTLIALVVALGVLVILVGGGVGLWLALRNRQPAAATVAATQPTVAQPTMEQPTVPPPPAAGPAEGGDQPGGPGQV